MRHLVTIRTIKELTPIEGADAIERATIDGWHVVVKKNDFKVGDEVIYFEIDSFLPESDPRYSFLMKSTRVFNGVKGHKLKTIKLRGQISQGLVLPSKAFPEITSYYEYDGDYADLIGVKKWEPKLPAQLQGSAKGYFPPFIRKTDQERCQNLVNEIFGDNKESVYEVTLKLDGSSCTIYHCNGEMGVCSRNLELKLDDPNNAENAFVKMFHISKLAEVLPSLGMNIAIQGELMGPGIQGNRENFTKTEFYVYDIFDIDKQEYLPYKERHFLLDMIMRVSPIHKVPLYNEDFTLDSHFITDIDGLLKMAEGPSVINPVREGLVFKRTDGKFSFKAISNAYLMKTDD